MPASTFHLIFGPPARVSGGVVSTFVEGVVALAEGEAFAEAELKRQALRLEGSVFEQSRSLHEGPGSKRIAPVGHALWRALPPGIRSRLLPELLSVLRHLGSVRLVLHTSRWPDVALLPWEALRLGEESKVGEDIVKAYPDPFPLRHRDVRVIRFVDAPNGEGPKDPAVLQGRLRVLPLVGSRRGHRDGQLAASPYPALEELARRGVIELAKSFSPRNADELRETLGRGWQVIHFLGHSYGEPLARGLVFEHEGEEWRLSAESLAEMVKGTPLRLIVLNACRCGDGLAETLLGAGLEHVVGMAGKVDPGVARMWSERFYEALTKERTVGEAVQSARCGLHEQWWMPVHWSRTLEERAFRTVEEFELEGYLAAVPSFTEILSLVGVRSTVDDPYIELTLGRKARNHRNNAREGRRGDPNEQELSSSVVPDWRVWRERDRVEKPEELDRMSARELLRGGGRWVVRGDPGAGKTTLLKHLARTVPRQGRVPVYLSLAAWCQSGEASLLQHWARWWFEKRKETATPMAVEDWASLAREWLRTGKAVLLLDGLDEVETSQRPGLKKRLSELASDPGYSRCPLIVTTRFAGYTSGELGGIFQEVEILPLEPRQAEGYLRTVLAEHPHRASDLMRELQRNVRLAILTGNPLLLEITALVFLEKQFQLPSDLVDLYDQAVHTLLHRALREAASGAPGLSMPTQSDLRRALERIAWESFKKNHQVVDESVILKKLEASFKRSYLQAPAVAREVLHYLRKQSRLLVQLSDGMYQFLHLTFLEYLAACELNRQACELNRQAKMLDYVDRACWLPRWEEVLRFLASMQPDPEPIVRTLLNARDDLHARRAWTASRCLAVARPTDSAPDRLRGWEALVRDVDRALYERWRGDDETIFQWFATRPRLRLALPHRYAGLSGLETTRVLVEMLRDQDGELGWVASESLQGTTDPRAIQALLENPGPGAARSLRGTTDPRAIQALVEMLRDHRWRHDIRGERSLGGTTDPRAIQALIEMLRDPEHEVRQAAAASLEGTTDPRAIQALVEMLPDQDPDVRRAAAWVLGGTTDPRAIPELVEMLRDPEHDVRQAAAASLGGTTDPRAIQALLEMLRDPEHDVRQAAAASLRGTTDPRAIQALVEMLPDQDPDVRRAAAWVLGGTTDPRAIPELVEMLRDQDPKVRWTATLRLEGTTDSRAVPVLVEMLRDLDPDVRRAAAASIEGTTDPRAIQALVEMLGDPDFWVRPGAARSLRGTTDPRAIRALVEMLHDPGNNVYVDDDDFRCIVGKSLEGTTDPRAIQALVEMLRDQDPNVRRAAAASLGGTTDPRAIQALVEMLPDQDPDVRRAAAASLEGTTDSRAIPVLVEMLRDLDPDVRRAAAASLGGTTDPRAIQALVEMLRDRHAIGDGSMADLSMSRIVMSRLPLWPDGIVIWSDLSCSPHHEVARGLC
jgi:HEAT repeat protein